MDHSLYIQASTILHHLCSIDAITCEDEEFRAVSSDPDLYAILQEMASSIQCRLHLGRRRMFIIPDPDNTVLGFNSGDLRKQFASSQDYAYFALQKLMFFNLLNMIYDTPNSRTKNREAVTYSLLLKETEDFLNRVLQENTGTDTERSWSDLKKFYDNLPADKEGIGTIRSNGKTRWTRREMASHLFRKLKSFNLISWDEKDEIIRPLALLDEQVECLLDDLASGDLYAYQKEESNYA